MNEFLFSENTRMADLVMTNRGLLYVLPCLGIGLGFGEKTVGQVCAERGLYVPLLSLVCNLYTFEGYAPAGDMLAMFCEKYRAEVVAHFKCEEEVVFPYIGKLLDGEKPKYKISLYRIHLLDARFVLRAKRNLKVRPLVWKRRLPAGVNRMPWSSS